MCGCAPAEVLRPCSTANLADICVPSEGTSLHYDIQGWVHPNSYSLPRRAPLNAQRANVGPASNDSKVNNIALKTAILVYFSALFELFVIIISFIDCIYLIIN